ncbi:MAG: hypothetical protein ACOX7B_08030 [Christensenellales bacterium]|jgi:hypothetical protein
MIQLWDGYAIMADEYQYILGRPTETKSKGEVRMRGVTYHGTLAKAVSCFRKIQARETIKQNDMSLGQALAALSELDKRFYMLLEGLELRGMTLEKSV